MDVSFDPAKDARNVDLRGISLARAVDFEWTDALIIEDTRTDYGESRYQALGLIEDRLYMLVFTPRAGKIHVISVRKANDREIRRYEKTQTQSRTD